MSCTGIKEKGRRHEDSFCGEETGSRRRHAEDEDATKHHGKQRLISSSLGLSDHLTLAMAALLVLLFLSFCEGERSGFSVATNLSDESPHLQVISSKGHLGSPQSESIENVPVSLDENPLQHVKDAVRADVALRLNDKELRVSEIEEGVTRQYLIAKQSPELTLNRQETNSLPNGDAEGVINVHSLVPSSGEEYGLQPELRLEAGPINALPERTGGRPKWTPYPAPLEPRSRRRRSWLWNQFFVIEEYRGPEPVLIGRVSHCHNTNIQFLIMSKCM